MVKLSFLCGFAVRVHFHPFYLWVVFLVDVNEPRVAIMRTRNNTYRSKRAATPTPPAGSRNRRRIDKPASSFPPNFKPTAQQTTEPPSLSDTLLCERVCIENSLNCNVTSYINVVFLQNTCKLQPPSCIVFNN